MTVTIGLFQYNPDTMHVDFGFAEFVEIGDNWLAVIIDNTVVRLTSDYYIKDFIRSGDITAVMMFEREGRLYPLNFSELEPLERRFLPPPVELEINAELYKNAEYIRLIELQKQLISEILTIAAKNSERKEFDQLLEENAAEEANDDKKEMSVKVNAEELEKEKECAKKREEKMNAEEDVNVEQPRSVLLL